MQIKHLCLIFGITPTVCSKVINQILILVAQKLKYHPLARVKFPDEEKMDSHFNLSEHQSLLSRIDVQWLP
jgi:hypothetical protein